MSNDAPNILISGSGIAGSVFSHWLLRAYPNATITIVERAPSFRLTGASVDIRSSAVDIIQWMNAEQQIRAQCTKEEGLQVVNADGQPIGTFRATGRTDIQGFTSEFEIFRGALAKIFMDPVLARDVKIIFDEYVDNFEQRDDQVVVTFAKSKEVKAYDLLVAADGLGSKIRGLILKSKPREQIFNAAHIAYFTIKSDLLEGSRMAKWYNASRGRCILLRPDPDPAGRTRANLLLVTRSADMESKEKFDAAIREGNESCMSLMEEIFADAGWLAPEVLRGMRECDDFYFSPFAQVKSPKLADGRVVLLGDAGYATPGIGTSLAIIGGYVLAGELLNHAGDVATALKSYEELMLPFVKQSQSGLPNAEFILNPVVHWGMTWAIRIGSAVLAFLQWTKLDTWVMAAAARLGGADKKLNMPDYHWPPA